MKKWVHPTGRIPKSVTLLALGPSRRDYILSQIRHNEGSRTEEIWTMNTGGRCFTHDLLWVMDDLKMQEHFDPGYGEFLKRHDKPIITSQAYDEYPSSLSFPVYEMIKDLGLDGLSLWFNNSSAWILSYAIWIGVKEIYLFGMDYDYPGQPIKERGKACSAFWIGYALARGVSVVVPPSSTMLDANDPSEPVYPISRFYGYLRPPITRRVANEGRKRSGDPGSREGWTGPTNGQPGQQDRKAGEDPLSGSKTPEGQNVRGSVGGAQKGEGESGQTRKKGPGLKLLSD